MIRTSGHRNHRNHARLGRGICPCYRGALLTTVRRTGTDMTAHQRSLAVHRSNSFFSAPLAETDPEIARAIELELGRQRHELSLIHI